MSQCSFPCKFSCTYSDRAPSNLNTRIGRVPIFCVTFLVQSASQLSDRCLSSLCKLKNAFLNMRTALRVSRTDAFSLYRNLRLIFAALNRVVFVFGPSCGLCKLKNAFLNMRTALRVSRTDAFSLYRNLRLIFAALNRVVFVFGPSCGLCKLKNAFLNMRTRRDVAQPASLRRAGPPSQSSTFESSLIFSYAGSRRSPAWQVFLD